MCGVDFNTASCEETAKTLTAAGVPHGTMFGDIGDPIPMQAALEKQFGVVRAWPCTAASISRGRHTS
jgi:hypothetical protein